MTSDFQPGDVIVRRRKNGTISRRCVVQDPPRTSWGKLRIKSDKATTVTTAWWRPDTLPASFEWVKP